MAMKKLTEFKIIISMFPIGVALITLSFFVKEWFPNHYLPYGSFFSGAHWPMMIIITTGISLCLFSFVFLLEACFDVVFDEIAERTAEKIKGETTIT